MPNQYAFDTDSTHDVFNAASLSSAMTIWKRDPERPMMIRRVGTNEVISVFSELFGETVWFTAETSTQEHRVLEEQRGTDTLESFIDFEQIPCDYFVQDVRFGGVTFYQGQDGLRRLSTDILTNGGVIWRTTTVADWVPLAVFIPEIGGFLHTASATEFERTQLAFAQDTLSTPFFLAGDEAATNALYAFCDTFSKIASALMRSRAA